MFTAIRKRLRAERQTSVFIPLSDLQIGHVYSSIEHIKSVQS